MADTPSYACRWTGDALEPAGGHLKRLRDSLEPGERVVVEVTRERYWAGHRRYFAEIRDAWLNLPETLNDAPYAVTPETLRKHALIATGWRDVQTLALESHEEAKRVSQIMQEMHREYCVVRVSRASAMIATAQSQSATAMGRVKFQQSKEDVLGWISQLLSEVQR